MMMYIKMGCDVLFYRIWKSKLCCIPMQDAECRMLKCRKQMLKSFKMHARPPPVVVPHADSDSFNPHRGFHLLLQKNMHPRRKAPPQAI